MKKYLLLLVFCVSFANLNADVLSKLKEITEKNPIKCNDYWNYIFSIYMNGNDLVVGIFSDTSNSASIIGYKKENVAFKIIIKYQTRELVRPTYDDRYGTTIDINYYYLVELIEINGKLESYCNRIGEINLNNFIINKAEIFENTVARFGPSVQWNEAIELEKGTLINVIGIEKEGNGAYNTYDYWHRVNINNQIYWVYGFFIEFKKTMRII